VQTLVEVYTPIIKEGFGMSIIKKVEVLASCRVAMEPPLRVCAAVGIVLLAVSCATTTKVTLPALDASITTEAEALVVYTDPNYVRGFVVQGKVIRGAGKGATGAMGDYLSDVLSAPSGGSVLVGILLAPIALPVSAVIGASMAHSKDEVDSKVKSLN